MRENPVQACLSPSSTAMDRIPLSLDRDWDGDLRGARFIPRPLPIVARQDPPIG